MAKMMRRQKEFGRCHVPGHGDNCYCEVMGDIQETPITRAYEKRNWKKEVEKVLEEEDDYK